MSEKRRPAVPATRVARTPATPAPAASTSAGRKPAVSRSASTATSRRTPATPSPAATGSVTTRMQQRLNEKRSAERRLLLTRVGRWVVIVGGAAAAVLVVLLSPLFALKADHIEIDGMTAVIDADQVDGVLSAYEGDSLVQFSTGRVAGELEQLVGVQDADVVRVWPDGLQVVVVASEPIAAIPDGERFSIVDDAGDEVLSVDAPPEGLPVLTIPVSSDDTRILEGVLAVVDDMPVDLREQVEGIEAATEDSIRFRLRGGPVVEWGSADDSALKAQVLQALLDSDNASAAAVIDVSAPTLPITREDDAA